MLGLSISSLPDVSIDTLEIELAQTGLKNYTIETLPLLRQRHPEIQRWVLILGSDQLRQLNTWHLWQHLPQQCHLAFTTREGISLGNLPPDIDAFVNQYGAQTLTRTATGSIVFFSMPPVAVSSSALRLALQRQQPVDGLLSPAVLHYIQTHGLYSPLHGTQQ